LKFNKKFLIAISVILILTAGAILVLAQERERKQKETAFESLDRFGEVFEKVLDYYVEELESEELINAAIDGMLKKLDPHSVYLDSYQYENLMIDTRGEFGGLGISIIVRDDFPTVLSPLEDTPAYSLGIQGGDVIVEIEGESTKGWKIEDAVKRLRGKPGTKVNITIAREGVEDSLHYTITREIIRVPSITYNDILDGVGYVRISRFSEDTVAELEKVLNEMEAKGIKGLMIDLRSNPGGLLQAAKEVSELFLEHGKLIVYTKGRLKKNNREYYSESNRVHNNYPLVLLSDRPLSVKAPCKHFSRSASLPLSNLPRRSTIPRAVDVSTESARKPTTGIRRIKRPRRRRNSIRRAAGSSTVAGV